MNMGAWMIDEADLRKFFEVVMSDFYKDYVKAIRRAVLWWKDWQAATLAVHVLFMVNGTTPS
jgi:hypothetical protein